MEYNSILKQVEEQKNEKSIAGKMFRYSGLIMAVDFFSQQMNSDQILDAAFDFVNELLILEHSLMFCMQNGTYRLIRGKGANNRILDFEPNEALRTLPVFHGSILTGKESIARYFGEELTQMLHLEIVIPIIVETDLEGFILVPAKASGPFDNDDHIICEVLMKLFNSAMKDYRTYNELRAINVNLDEKIFNLFAINQSSKALLSELELDALYRLSIDVFSELTQSSCTGFILYDEKSEKYSLKSSRFIFKSNFSPLIELAMNKSAAMDPNRIIIDLTKESDRNYFNTIFPGGVEALNELEPLYLVLLNRGNGILGFVTLGRNVSCLEYKASCFELIESLASSTYISISNAKHFKLVNEQKALMQKKLDRLISLNKLTRNINSSSSVETLAEITINTLRISFDAEKCLMALYEKESDRFLIKSSFGIDDQAGTIPLNGQWKKVKQGSAALVYDKNEMAVWFGDSAERTFHGASAALIVPIYLDRAEIELLGVIIVFEFYGSFPSDEENVLTMETIAGHIAPILYHMQVNMEQKETLMPDYTEIFKNDLKREIHQAEELNLELGVIRLFNPEPFNFRYPDMEGSLKENYQKIYPLSYNTVYMLTNRSISDTAALKTELRNAAGLENLSVEIRRYGFDFKSFDEYCALY